MITLNERFANETNQGSGEGGVQYASGAGIEGYAAHFDQKSDYIQYAAAKFPAAGTIVWRGRLTSIPTGVAYYTLLDTIGTAAQVLGDMFLMVLADGYVKFTMCNGVGGNPAITSTRVLEAGVFYEIAVSFGDGGMKMWLDRLEETVTEAGSGFTIEHNPARAVTLGDFQGTPGVYTGFIGDADWIKVSDVQSDKLLIYGPQPALSGAESVVGLTREPDWGETPVTGAVGAKTIAGIVFFPVKEESIQDQPSADPQADDLNASREIVRIHSHGTHPAGAVRLEPGPESLGYLLTALFGTPATSTLSSSGGTAAYQHIWYPGQVTDRTQWPAPHSIESIFAATRSKLVRGALLQHLALDVPNNGPLAAGCDWLGKNLIWLTSESDGENSLGESRPAVMTANPTVIEEDAFHFKQIVAYPQIDDVNVEEVLSIGLDFAFPGLEMLFTGGSGDHPGNYRVDKFQFSGRATMLFENEEYWELFRQSFFKVAVTLRAAEAILGAYYPQLEIIGYSCRASASDVPNRVGTHAYDFGWAGREDPTEGKSCQITLVNTVSSYE
jgi:hypothetical protein